MYILFWHTDNICFCTILGTMTTMRFWHIDATPTIQWGRGEETAPQTLEREEGEGEEAISRVGIEAVMEGGGGGKSEVGRGGTKLH